MSSPPGSPAGRAPSRQPEVSVLIPAYEAGAFIQRTLDCARQQAGAEVRVLVSVDRSQDATADICRAAAGTDPRISVFVHQERLGWAGNVNFLLGKADTEFHFLYFHDDVIAPDYCARLLAALKARPDAATAHCEIGHYGGSTLINQSRAYDGPPAERLCAHLLTRPGGAVFRALTRRNAVGDSRLLTVGPAGFLAHEPYLMELVAAGPALHVPEVLYTRWERRAGGLISAWLKVPAPELREAARAAAEAELAIADRVAASPAEREALVFCVYLSLMWSIRAMTEAVHQPIVTGPWDLHAAFADPRPPGGLDALDPRTHAAALAAHAKIDRWLALTRP